MAGRLQGKVAVVTGGGSGIGAEVVRAFAGEGASVLLCGRRREKLDEVVKSVAGSAGTAEARTCDVSDETQVDALLRGVAQERGRIDILVNNAFNMVAAPIAQLSTADWHAAFRTTLDGAFFALRSVFPLMEAQGGGSIINVSSTAGLAGSEALAGYGSSKAALENLTRIAAVEMARAGIRVNSLCPGVIAAGGTLDAFADPSMAAAMKRLVPLGRFGEPEEVARCAVFLASDESSFVTGATLIVDGGQRAALGAPSLEGFEHN